MQRENWASIDPNTSILRSKCDINSRSSAKLFTKSAFVFWDASRSAQPHLASATLETLTALLGPQKLPREIWVQPIQDSHGPAVLNRAVGLAKSLPEDFQLFPLRGGRLAELKMCFSFTSSSGCFICLLPYLHILPPTLHSSLNFQLLIRQSTAARSSVIKELKPYLKNADVMAKLNYLNKASPLIMHVPQSFIS